MATEVAGQLRYGSYSRCSRLHTTNVLPEESISTTANSFFTSRTVSSAIFRSLLEYMREEPRPRHCSRYAEIRREQGQKAGDK